jgi:hypothetical protein
MSYSLVSLCHANMLSIDEIHEPEVGLDAESADGFEVYIIERRTCILKVDTHCLY